MSEVKYRIDKKRDGRPYPWRICRVLPNGTLLQVRFCSSWDGAMKYLAEWGSRWDKIS